jgi:hypothetical protein
MESMEIPADATPRERELYAVVARLEARIAELEALLVEREALVTELRARLARAARNS